MEEATLLTATVTATWSYLHRSMVIAPAEPRPGRTSPPVDSHGRAEDPCPDQRICECRCGAPGWRTSRLGVGDPTWLSTDPAASACPSSDLPVVVAGTGLAHQLA
jgi:hypothetical protein